MIYLKKFNEGLERDPECFLCHGEGKEPHCPVCGKQLDYGSDEIDEEEFEVKPAIQRVTQLIEMDTSYRKRKRNKNPENPDQFEMPFLFVSGNTMLTDVIDFTANMSLISTDNVDTFDVFINGDYYGSDLQRIEITTNDVLRIEVIKNDNTQPANILFENKLV
mgnify:CR=1 FL=1